jgi:hypothetical protein
MRFVRALVAASLALIPLFALAAWMEAHGKPLGMWLGFLVYGASAVLIAGVLERQAEHH